MSRRAVQASLRIARMLLGVMLALGVGGCTGSRRPMSPEPAVDWSPHAPGTGAQPSPVVRLQDAAEVRYHMRMHFDDLRHVEQLLAAGRLDEGRSLAHLLSRPTGDAGLARWEEQSRRVTDAALELTRAPDVDEALRRLARVAVACAGCHAAAGRVPTFASPPPPPDRQTRETRMARHAWAADRLWEAIVGNDDARWRSGMAVLAEAPLPATILEGGSRLARDLQVYARKELDTREATPVKARGTAYGEILMLCARCHAAHD